LYYFRDEVAKELPLTGDLATDSKAFEEAVANGNKTLKAIRQRGKAPSFALQYGAYPKKIAESIKCSYEEAQNIFDMYHNALYPNVTRYREQQILPAAEQNGQVHLGLGCIIQTDDPEKDARTIVNATSQYWSILTLLTINKLHQQIDKAGLQEDIKIVASVYDSVYFEIREDPHTIKWLNDTLIPIMVAPFIVDQKVPNLADLELGLDWYDLHLLPNNSDLGTITSLIATIKDSHDN